MGASEKEQVERFIHGLQGLMLGMQQVDSSCMEAFGPISKRDFGLCVMIGQQGSMIMRQVAEFIQVPMSTATGVIDKLIERDLVERDYSPQDRRIVIVSLSPKGKGIYNMLWEKLFHYGHHVLNEFTNEEKNQFIDLMERAVSSTSKLEKVL